MFMKPVLCIQSDRVKMFYGIELKAEFESDNCLIFKWVLQIKQRLGSDNSVAIFFIFTLSLSDSHKLNVMHQKHLSKEPTSCLIRIVCFLIQIK